MTRTSLTQNDPRMQGDALNNGVCIAALWNLLVAVGVLSKDQALGSLDAALLAMEDRRQTWQGEVAVIDQARGRLEALIEQVRKVPRMAAMGG